MHWVFTVQCCSKSITTTLNMIFSCTMLSGEPLGQHCTKDFSIQCCPKSIKTILNIIFSCTMLSVVSWTAFHKKITCD